MRQIYGAAKLVIVRLGDETDDSYKAIQMVKNVAEGISQQLDENLSMAETSKRHKELVLARLTIPENNTWVAYWALRTICQILLSIDVTLPHHKIPPT